ncbi:MAG: hypothetical protein IKP42_05835 [Ruminococcus sp.]|nr:hypothetical protein [Ruminococcus sp.]
MKEMKLITIETYYQKQTVPSHLKILSYPEVDQVISDYVNKGYEVKTMTEDHVNHTITILFEKEV